MDVSDQSGFHATHELVRRWVEAGDAIDAEPFNPIFHNDLLVCFVGGGVYETMERGN